jgi:hypothetical protein
LTTFSIWTKKWRRAARKRRVIFNLSDFPALAKIIYKKWQGTPWASCPNALALDLKRKIIIITVGFVMSLTAIVFSGMQHKR